MPRFAANLTFLFNTLPFLERFEAASNAGFDAVEFTFPYEYSAADIARAAREAKVEIALFNAPPGDLDAGEFGLAALRGRQSNFRHSLELALEYARPLNCGQVHVMAGVADPQDAAAADTYRANLSDACEAFAPFCINVLIEPLSRKTRANYFLNSFSTAETLISELGRPNLKIQFDLFHRQILHGDVTEALQRLMPHIAHVQVASVPDRHEPNTGELADMRIFALLDELGFNGMVGAEYHPSNDTSAHLNWFKPYRRR